MDMTTTHKQRGRPPAFNHEEALEKAMQVFWSHGYEGASMAVLTEAMGINKPSLYGAFGSKEALFRKALQRYLAGPVAYVAESLKEPTARKVVEKFLTESANLLTGLHNPRGCLVIQGALTCGQGSEIIQQELAFHRKAYEDALRQRFEQAKEQRDLPENANAAVLARFVATVHQGMSVQATSGATKNELLEVVQMVLGNWPPAP
ncbi:HTH-type transcriptional repressor ComR [Methylophilaceae bacterium]|nr:HTH-type transcriptional repressor ComR [Methylophilaceae bacterium]